ncbi:hypothetical protein F4805DRAFT_461942 [Annulohypoxylon moriforme]|nr:hypothetical protein F4805DRAFT_461942 [Annulohypoxylon moriforme]
MTIEYNRLLREELTLALHQRPYTKLVQTFPTEFGITQRFVLVGCRWTEAPETNVLGPNPPLDCELDGLRWWYAQGMGGEVDDEIAKRFNALNYPAHLMTQNILNWMDWFPSNPDEFSAVGNKTISNISAATSWEDRQSITDRCIIISLPSTESSSDSDE